jgi:hypothetical protein
VFDAPAAAFVSPVPAPVVTNELVGAHVESAQ